MPRAITATISGHLDATIEPGIPEFQASRGISTSLIFDTGGRSCRWSAGSGKSSVLGERDGAIAEYHAILAMTLYFPALELLIVKLGIQPAP
jgi:hypothetical protein